MSTPETVAKQWIYSNSLRVTVCVACGIVATLMCLGLNVRPMAPLIGWDVGALIYVAWTLTTTLRLGADRTEALASSEDPGRAGVDLALLSASIASLGGVVVTLIEANQAKGSDEFILIGTVIVSIVLSWLLVHTIYTLVYARLYYDEPSGGIEFNEDEKPDYRDFAYLSFTIGMTFQVSDTAVSNKRIRRAILRHAALSYLFSTVIVATTVNVVAGLGK